MKHLNHLVSMLLAFGFKHGIQKDADLVFDVRFCQIRTMLKT